MHEQFQDVKIKIKILTSLIVLKILFIIGIQSPSPLHPKPINDPRRLQAVGVGGLRKINMGNWVVNQPPHHEDLGAIQCQIRANS